MSTNPMPYLQSARPLVPIVLLGFLFFHASDAAAAYPGKPYSATPAAIPGTVQAENFDTGGQNVAYYSPENTNLYGQYRPNAGVSLEVSTDSGGGFDVAATRSYEWINYTVNIASGGTYTISTRVASKGQGGTFHYKVDFVDATAEQTVPDTGGWQNWTTLATGIVLTAGTHVLQLHMDLVSSTTQNIGNFNWISVTAQTTSGSSSAAARQKVLSYLDGISGNHTLVGVEDKDAGNPTSDSDQVASIAGRKPSFWGGDFGFGSYAVGNRQTLINEAQTQWKAGAVVALMYHACAPTGNEYCTWDDIGGATPVHLTSAQWVQLTTPGTSLYNAWIGRLDTLAGYFQQLKNADVAVLFRPLHEMNQCVFWWACQAGPNGSARLYQITHDYLTNTKGLDNIIWVWNVQDFTTLTADIPKYDPGSAYYDIAALDIYNTGYTTNNYNAMIGVAGSKLIAVAECQFMPTSSLLSAQNRWAYVMLWPDFIADNTGNLPVLYGASNVITLDRMPGWN